MLLYRRGIVLEVCLILVATHQAISQEYDYSEDDEKKSEYTEDGSPDYTKYFAAASNQDKKYNDGFPNDAEWESFFVDLYKNDPASKESSAPQSFAPQPSKETDPFEALRRSFTQKEEASESNPLKKDYFDESQKNQKKQQKEDDDGIYSGPNYVSHQIPLPLSFDTDDEDKAQSKDDVETIPPPLQGKPNKKKVQVAPSRPGFDGFKDSYDAFELLRKTEEQIEQTKIDPTNIYHPKSVDYSTGKSSAISQAYPAASGYLESLKIPTTTLSPYQKYSFQPDTRRYEALQSKYLGNYANTPNPLKNIETAALNSKDDGLVQPSENVPENLKNKGCRRIESPENSEGMNCFVCEDAANKAKYTQCSYASSEEPVNAYAGSSLRYSSPIEAPASFRRKRSTKGSYGDDPYFRVAQNNKQYFADFEKEQKEEESKRQKDWTYSPYDHDYESYSESQSSELLKEPGACQEVEREGMTCTVCKNAKTGGNFEQCSYTSAPKEQKYAYVAEKKYDSEEDEPEETKTIIKSSSEDEPHESQKGESSNISTASTSAPVSEFSSATKSKIVRDVIPELDMAGTTIDETTEEKPETEESDDDDDESAESTENDEESDDSEEKEERSESSDDDGPTYLFNYDELKKDKKLINEDPYYIPEHFAESVSKKKTAKEEEDDDSFDEYHYKLFPVFQNDEAESKNEEQRNNPNGNQQDVEEVLAEFAKKDRSTCKKAEKNGMTCFLCIDQNKVQHEECMYIAESKPKATHVAFHEVQRLKDPKENNPVDLESAVEESKVEAITEQTLDTVLPLASETSKRKKFFKKVITTPLPLQGLELAAAASDVYRTIVPFEKSKKRYSSKVRKDQKVSGSAPDSERLEESGDESKKDGSKEPEAPKEIDVGDEEGAYSHETEPVYSKRFGTTLPKYMVEKTEFEKEFDAVSGFD